jgi:hypothetical protein
MCAGQRNSPFHAAQSKQAAKFSIRHSLQCKLAERGIGVTLLVKSDRLSMIMLAVNAGVPPLFLVAMTALIVRQMVIA